MTLILIAANQDTLFQFSDRRISTHSSVVSDEFNKATIIEAYDANLVCGFSGIAQISGWTTQKMLLDALGEIKKRGVITANEIVHELKDELNCAFRANPLTRLKPEEKRLSLMCSGWLQRGNEHWLGTAIITNFQNFQSGKDEPSAWDEFKIKFDLFKKETFTCVQRIGNWHGMNDTHVASIRKVLSSKTSLSDIENRIKGIFLDIAKSFHSGITIGTQLSVITLPKGDIAHSKYISHRPPDDTYFPDKVFMNPSAPVTQISNFKIGPVEKQNIRKVSKNARCPCGSGLKYKRCHGRGQ